MGGKVRAIKDRPAAAGIGAWNLLLGVMLIRRALDPNLPTGIWGWLAFLFALSGTLILAGLTWPSDGNLRHGIHVEKVGWILSSTAGTSAIVIVQAFNDPPELIAWLIMHVLVSVSRWLYLNSYENRLDRARAWRIAHINERGTDGDGGHDTSTSRARQLRTLDSDNANSDTETHQPSRKIR